MPIQYFVCWKYMPARVTLQHNRTVKKEGPPYRRPTQTKLYKRKDNEEKSRARFRKNTPLAAPAVRQRRSAELTVLPTLAGSLPPEGGGRP